MNPLPRLPVRDPEGHKGSYGTALLVGGSPSMSGAISLAAMAALRSGAGLVRVATSSQCLNVVAGHEPSYMTVPLPTDRKGRISLSAEAVIRKQAAAATAVALGPGLGRSLGLDALVWRLYADLPQPLVVDADALNALSARWSWDRLPAGPRVLTPHPGEFARLLHREPIEPERREQMAVELAAQSRTVVVLKGHRTLITDGRTWWKNTTGNPGMATGGSGDVLTGIITALLCQHLPPFDAARLGVFLHGLAGDLAAAELGQESLIASDLLRFLPAAFREFHRKNG